MTSVYCTAPWNGITVRENGDVRTCCIGSTTLGNLNTDSIENIIESPELSRIQHNLLNNVSDKNCRGCVMQEKNSGLSALRQHYLKMYPDIQDKIKFKNLDIRWNNLCNLSCMYCTPNFSSAWQSKLKIKIHTPIKEYQNDLLKFILDKADQVKEIMLVGGEPMLMKQNYDLIQQLPPTTVISIITNMSYDLEKLPCIDVLINRPSENTIWNISLENTQKQFEYVRNGAEWQQVEKNLKFLNQFWMNNISVNMVYSMFNAFDVDYVVSELLDLQIKKFSFQTYFGNPAFDVFSMPTAIQAQALEILQRAKNNYHSNIVDKELFSMQNVDMIISQLELKKEPDTPLTKQQFYERVNWCDQWSDSKFHDLWPHVINHVDTHLK